MRQTREGLWTRWQGWQNVGKVGMSACQGDKEGGGRDVFSKVKFLFLKKMPTEREHSAGICGP
ncbi:MAG: hypothetical protein AAB354_05665, partial [candidate division KSB1 bacterium]